MKRILEFEDEDAEQFTHALNAMNYYTCLAEIRQMCLLNKETRSVDIPERILEHIKMCVPELE